MSVENLNDSPKDGINLYFDFANELIRREKKTLREKAEREGKTFNMTNIPRHLVMIQTICDYCGKKNDDIYTAYIPYTYHRGILACKTHYELAKQDINMYCKFVGICKSLMPINELQQLSIKRSNGVIEHKWRGSYTGYDTQRDKIYVICESPSGNIVKGEDLDVLCVLNQLNYSDIKEKIISII